MAYNGAMRILIILGMLLIAGCTAASSPAPTAPPVATAPPTVARPQPGGTRLPAPLYLLDRGQIARIERDGVTRAQLTRERLEIEGVNPIHTFTIAPGGDLAYVVGDLDADRLVRADPRGANPRTLYSEPLHELSDLAWSPDGSFIALRLLNNKEPPDIPSGIYRLSADGGRPELLRPDDPVDDLANPSRALRGYRPFLFATTGALLVEAFSLFYEGCDLAVLPPGGELARITVPDGISTYCGEAAWSPDGASVLFLAGKPPGPGGGPTLWRASASGGLAEPISAPTDLARAPFVAPDGTLRFFLVRLREADGIAGAEFTMASLAGAGATPMPLAPPTPDQPAFVLWAPDGSGAVAELVPADAASALRWLPADGSPSLDLPQTGAGIGGAAWGQP